MYNPQPQWVPQARQYEFGRYENSVFGDVARWMTVAAVVNALGLLTPLHVEGALGGVLTLVVSLLLWMGASAFRRVVSTQGNDVTHLMEALDRLTTVLTLRSVARIVGFALAAVLVTMALLAFVALESLR
jgi:hypothetical protein